MILRIAKAISVFVVVQIATVLAGLLVPVGFWFLLGLLACVGGIWWVARLEERAWIEDLEMFANEEPYREVW
jgi:hypothetical protein